MFPQEQAEEWEGKQWLFRVARRVLYEVRQPAGGVARDHDTLLGGGDIEHVGDARAQALIGVVRPDTQKENSGPLLGHAPTIARASSTSRYRHIKRIDEAGHQSGGLQAELPTQQLAIGAVLA